MNSVLVNNKIFLDYDISLLLAYYEQREGIYLSLLNNVCVLNDDVKREICKYLPNVRLLSKSYIDLYYDRWCCVPFTQEMIVNYLNKIKNCHILMFKEARNKFTMYDIFGKTVVVETFILTNKKIIVKSKTRLLVDVLDTVTFHTKYYDLITIFNILYYGSADRTKIEYALNREVTKFKPVKINTVRNLFHNVKCFIYSYIVDGSVRVNNYRSLKNYIDKIRFDTSTIKTENINYFENMVYHEQLQKKVDEMLYKYDNDLLLPKYRHRV